jgi:hypothetical protein
MHQQTPTPREQVQIAARGECAPKTVARAYRGMPIYDTTRARIERAAQELGLPLPPAQQERAV